MHTQTQSLPIIHISIDAQSLPAIHSGHDKIRVVFPRLFNEKWQVVEINTKSLNSGYFPLVRFSAIISIEKTWTKDLIVRVQHNFILENLIYN